jgi:hypothetical protein
VPRKADPWADTEAAPVPPDVVVALDKLTGARVRYWALRFRCEKWPCDECTDECSRVRQAMMPATDWTALDE